MVFFYMNRLFRIGLPYGLFILFMIGVPPLIITSPLSAAQYVQDEARQCVNRWQDHLMYTNNFPQGSGCVGQSWFLGTDMWFFFASPIIVYPLWLSKFGRSQKMAAYLWWLLFPILSIASQLRCLIGATDTGDTEKYCLTNIAQNLDFAPWGHRNQCYITGLQLPFKRLHVPRQSGGGSFIWPSLLHRDGTASRKTAKDYHRRLCDQDDKGRKVDSANFSHFHRSHSLHCC